MAGLSKSTTELRIAGSKPRFKAATSKVQVKKRQILSQLHNIYSSCQSTQHKVFDFNIRHHTVLFMTMNCTSHCQHNDGKKYYYYKFFVWGIFYTYQSLRLGH